MKIRIVAIVAVLAIGSLFAQVASNTNTGSTYATVQLAVDAATTGQTVVVFEGTNTERVFITNKTGVALIGYPWLTNADNTKAIFDGTGISATLSAGVTISNSSGIIVRGMTFRLYTNGVHLWANATNCVVEANIIYSNGYNMPGGFAGGILINSSTVFSNAFQSNFIWRNNAGIINSNSSSLLYYGNVIASNTSLGLGAAAWQGNTRYSNYVINNVFLSNAGSGINFIANYELCSIVSNVFVSNASRGISFDGVRNTAVVSNTVIFNFGGGIGWNNGGASHYSNMVAFNYISSNSSFGLGLLPNNTQTFRDHYIISNTLIGNQTGIWITNGSNTIIRYNDIYNATNGITITDAKMNIITRNNITNCTNYGVSLSGSGMVNGVWVGGYMAGNNVYSNGTNLFLANSIALTPMAHSNYWGSTHYGTVIGRIDQTTAQGTNFIAPYRFGMVGVTQSDIDPLLPPLITNVVTNVASNIVVQWQTVAGASGYRLFRSAGEDTWTNFSNEYTNFNAATTTFTDTNVTVGVRYFYFLTSIDSETPLSNESWFSASSNTRILPANFAEFTNPAPNSWMTPMMNTFGGEYFPLSGAVVTFSADGSTFGMPATNNGSWTTNLDLAAYMGTTNIFYAVISNTSTGVVVTNAQSNFIAPIIASNLSNNSRYIYVAQAVSNASNGQTIAVFAGTFREKVVVSGKTNFALVGWPWVTNNDNTKAVIDGFSQSGDNNKGIELTNSVSVRVEGLSVCNFTNGIFLSANISNCLILNNNIYSNGNVDATNLWRGGVVLFASTTVSNFIVSNRLWGNRQGVVFLGGPSNTFIANRIYWSRANGAGYPDWNRMMSGSYFEGNTFCSNAGAGFNGWGGQGNVRFFSNTFFSNSGNGIVIPSWYNTTFISNDVISNIGNGMEFSWSSRSNIFLYNHILSNSIGIYINGDYGTGDVSNYVVSNDIIGNRSDGVRIRHADRNFIGYNNILSNAARGVYIEAATNGITFSNIIYNNVLAGNTNEGVYFAYNAVVNNLVMSNIIRENQYGMRIHEGDSNIIFGNTIYSNQREGIVLLTNSNNVSFNSIQSNIIYGHTNVGYGRGIQIIGDGADTNTITSNVIYGNITGLEVSDAEQLVIKFNTITNNSYCGLYSSGNYDNNQGVGFVSYNNFIGNLTNMRVNTQWYSTNIWSNYFGTLNADAISNSIANCSSTNFFAPYLLGMVGICQADVVPPASPTGVTKAVTGTTNYLTWSTVPGAAGYTIWRTTGVNEWSNCTAPYAKVTTPGYLDTNAGAAYFYYVTAFDNAVPLSNESWFSAPETIANTPPVLTNFSMTPADWITNTPYVSSVIYYDYEGNGPSNGVYVVLSNSSSGVALTNAMLLASGTFTGGATYTNSTTITVAGSYTSFAYAAGSNSSVVPSVSTSLAAPYVVNAYVASNTNLGVRYGSLQEAVDAAQSGQTVVMFAGSISEQLVITNKTNITLAGLAWITNNDNTKAVLNGTALSGMTHGIHVTNSVNVRILGFSIANYTNGIYVSANVSNCVIQSNFIFSNGVGYTTGYAAGIHLYQPTVVSNLIAGNTLWQNRSGIIMSNVSMNAVRSNVISSNTYQGIVAAINYVTDARSNNSFIANTICSNGDNGILFRGNWISNTIISNLIFNNTGSGIYVDGFRLGDVAFNEIFSNTASGVNYQSGGAAMDSSVFRMNHVYRNTQYGFSILSETADTNSIISNLIHDNSTGVYIQSGDYTAIASNVIYNCTNGITLQDNQTNSVFRNTITNCTNYGVYLGGTGMVNGAVWVGGDVTVNNIFLNGSNFRISDTVNFSNIARSNYWGTIDVAQIAVKMDQVMAKATNFYTPYRLGMIGIDQADIDPLAPPLITNTITNAASNIVIQWQAVGGATGYRIYRNPVSETWTNFSTYYTNLGAVTSFTDTNVAVGTRYYYYLTSIDNGAPLANESWFSDPSNARLLPSYYAEITNPAPNTSLFPSTYTFSGNYGPLSGAAIYFSANGTVFGMPSTNNGMWTTNIDVSAYLGTTNTFYAVASNTALGLAETNVQLNYIAPIIATNLSNGAFYISVAQAVTAASNGQTVAVFSGKANENVIVTGKTNFTLIGWPWVTNANNTAAVLSGNGMSAMDNHGILLTNAVGVRIEGLTIREFTNGIFLAANVSNCYIVNNNLFSNGGPSSTNSAIALYPNSAVSNFVLTNNVWSNRNGITLYDADRNVFIANRVFWNSNSGFNVAHYNYSPTQEIFEGNIICSNGGVGFSAQGGGAGSRFISNMIFRNNNRGISMTSWDNNLFISNAVYSNSSDGFYLDWGMRSNMFVNNYFGYNSIGFYLYGDNTSEDRTNVFISNDFVCNTSDGIRIRHADLNFISNNNILSNGARGIFIEAPTNGITYSNFICNNVIAGNTNEGVYVSQNAIVNNLIMSNILFGNQYGIRINEGDSNVIFGNTIFSNQRDGIMLSTNANNVSFNIIQSNIIFGHVDSGYGRGVFINGDGADTNTIVSNVITGNRTGIEIADAEGLVIMLNMVSNNSQWGIYSSGTFDANMGPGLIVLNNFSNNPYHLSVSAQWYSTNIRSNYFGTINAGEISNSIANCAGTNFFAPYLLRPINVFGADITPPATCPSVTNVTTGLNGKIGVLWSSVAGASGYRVYRSEQNDTWTNLYTYISDVAVVGYTDQTVLPGTNYYYYVTAYDAVSNETWFSDAFGSSGNINPAFWLTLTNPAPLSWITASNYTYRGMFGPEVNTRPFYSTNGIDFQMITTTNSAGGWWLSATLPFGSGPTNITNVFYVMLSNNSDRWTNLVTNYFDGSAPVAALTNLPANTLVTNTFTFWGTVSDAETGISSVSVLISNAVGYMTNIPAAISNTTQFYASWDSFPASISNGTYFAYVTAMNNAGLAGYCAPIQFAVSNQRASEVVESAYVFNNPYNGVGDIVFKDLPTNSTVSIYTVSGKLLTKLSLPEGDVNGILTWNVADANGRLASPGVYVCYVNSPAGVRIMKLIIKRRKQ
ncbi:MAG: right-handed parallel beta-helix repeat-containing protein [Spirochaetes bacterium]|nr:right-handed parallel beta-helix repeat-containing protein [Spirochaetota bacterium]